MIIGTPDHGSPLAGTVYTRRPLVAVIAFINTYNRLNVITQEPAVNYHPGQFGLPLAALRQHLAGTAASSTRR